MTIALIRIFLVLFSVVSGYYIGTFVSPPDRWPIIGAVTGLIFSCLLILAESMMKRVSTRNLSAGLVGLIFGIFMSLVLTNVIKLIPMADNAYLSVQIILTLIFCYLGMVLALRGKDDFSLVIPYVRFTRQDQSEQIAVLDTSVIIDGRIADICATKFLDAKLVIPRFVLREIQQIADSQDAMKRTRGRRGLDILNKIQKSSDVPFKIAEDDFPELTEVDAKLVKLGKMLNAKVLTNDYNLNKVAELQGVTVLNVNDLANALRPVVLPGEILPVRIAKEGKEYNQGVAYLDDGTMVVVDNARHIIGQTVRTTVTSVLQTSAGRMIFAKLEDQRPQSWK